MAILRHFALGRGEREEALVALFSTEVGFLPLVFHIPARHYQSHRGCVYEFLFCLILGHSLLGSNHLASRNFHSARIPQTQ